MATVPSKKVAMTTNSAVKPIPKTVGKTAVVPAKKIATAAKLAASPAVKSITKPAAKPIVKKSAAKAKPVAKVAVKASPAKPAVAKAVAAAPVKDKIKKEKLVRDSFTMPESEYEVLSRVKKACLSAGVEVKKSQLLRIGLVLLNKANVVELKTLINALAPLKAGRPKKDK
ncbi:hypothetical protein LPB67_03610 [Undibacterium sp. Jales W-56]|uniref:hypothetical protein n=1 Tax=Undibacterium sp. Jales W-56 TaxID=2897325 RepID=UPI0021D0AD4F|nr:hypothetical protein [Undibacterium sp. Jales W-56]MCU6432865.1 hypothetical protein [Undibacterium sp. Jales W-56]